SAGRSGLSSPFLSARHAAPEAAGGPIARFALLALLARVWPLSASTTLPLPCLVNALVGLMSSAPTPIAHTSTSVAMTIWNESLLYTVSLTKLKRYALAKRAGLGDGGLPPPKPAVLVSRRCQPGRR